MKEYESVRTQAAQLQTVANGHAMNDWRVLAVLPAQYMPAVGASGLELTEVVIIFERGA